MSQTMAIKVPVPRKKKWQKTVHSFTPSAHKSMKMSSYSGKLRGNHVVVEYSGDAYDLYTKGCFGKGSLSRSLPEFQNLQPVIDIPKNNELIQLKIMKLSRYFTHLKWKKCVSNDDLSISDDEDDDDPDNDGTGIDDAEYKVVPEEPTESSVGAKTDETITEYSKGTKPLSQVNKNIPLHPLCKIDEDAANVFVVDQRQLKSETVEDNSRRSTQWLPSLKQDPYSMGEVLLLIYEEAFFLTYGLGCLLVKDNQGNPLKISEMWKTFYKNRSDFLPKYIAYHYYRSQGWIPKPGIKFGCDFILYKDGQLFYHATYSVLVFMVEEGSLEEDPRWSVRNLDWMTLAGLDRMNEHVSKQLMFCYVIKPKDITEEELLSPNCISRFKVQEVLMSRWISNQDREKKNDKLPEEFP
ncbi:tRNA-splicing endonuclease subunit Sen2 isoform X1 [Octopus bimaculoides]|uniref:tRNA-splicing endonuclease subunit Sen2 n=2 Tax=Octopus bimaculoides TaxID=37653 RepID=A0A0L8FKS0_OCTBM|nr:tRNA-splicing endonuclease subunit Sen2 isoform X1 [Octopus bimaculoides]|eukprot:XP_014788972.1 PREDICTED: tRNA-splicing endonuclease subunit Sen2-like isoform X1 [Octopus bimaculoides]